MKENRELELKLTITNTFLKTVSAFANYGSGRIIFGIDDNGKIVGIDDLDETCLNLENKINDNIVPKPNFSFIKNNRDKTITLVVKEGLDKPYLYKGKAYKRNDASTIEVDRLELNRLTLEGMNRYFEELRSNDQDLKFEVLKKELKEGTILFKWCLIVLTVFFLIMYLVQNNITEIKEHWKDPLLLVLPFYTILIIIRITELIDYYIKLWKIIKLEKKENY